MFRTMRQTFALLLVFALPVICAAQQKSAPPIRLPDDLVKFLSGEWTGQGEFASGKKIEADVSFSVDLDGQWLMYRHTDRAPNKYKAVGMWGFERSGRFIMTVNDNFGGARRFSSDGWINGKVVFETILDDATPASTIKERFTFERQDADTFKMTYETSQDAKTWRLGDYLVFKRKRLGGNVYEVFPHSKIPRGVFSSRYTRV